jgi:hypothetical protein
MPVATSSQNQTLKTRRQRKSKVGKNSKTKTTISSPLLNATFAESLVAEDMPSRSLAAVQMDAQQPEAVQGSESIVQLEPLASHPLTCCQAGGFPQTEDALVMSPSLMYTHPQAPPTMILPPITSLLSSVDLLNYQNTKVMTVSRLDWPPPMRRPSMNYSSRIEDVSVMKSGPPLQRDSVSGQTYVRSQYIITAQDSMWHSNN